MPPPIGVVSGPLIPIRCDRNASTVSSGSQLPVSSNAFWPASTSFQATVWPCLAAAASRTSLAAGQMSTPVPSPSMKGMMGSSGTIRVPSSPMRMRSAMEAMLRGWRSGVPIDGGSSSPEVAGRGRPAAASARQQPGEAGVLLASPGPGSRPPSRASARPSTRCPSASISSMSSQSLGRSKMALQTIRCSGARIGISTGPKRTTAAPTRPSRGGSPWWRRRRRGRSRPSRAGPGRPGRWRPDPRASP